MDGKSASHRPKIALLAGGVSAERNISLASGEQAYLALVQAGYETTRFDPAESELHSIDWKPFHACLIALHGGTGEDGRVQAFLQQRNVPYTGSGPHASALAMNKAAAKKRFLSCDVPTPPFIAFPASEIANVAAPQLATRLCALGYPLVIKPQNQGSSLGVAVATSADQLANAVVRASEFDVDLIAEPCIVGREFTIAMLGRKPLPMIEVKITGSVFSFDAKYVSREADVAFDTGLPQSTQFEIYSAAVNAVESLGTAGLARVDLMLDANGSVWILEVNTIPGLTAKSLAPRAARAAGIDMPMLMDWMVRDALRKAQPQVSAEQHLRIIRHATANSAAILGAGT